MRTSRMDDRAPRPGAGALALLLQVLLDFLLDLVDDLLDAGRVDPAVGDEPLEGDLGDLRRSSCVPGDDDRLRSVVHDEVHAGREAGARRMLRLGR